MKIKKRIFMKANYFPHPQVVTWDPVQKLITINPYLERPEPFKKGSLRGITACQWWPFTTHSQDGSEKSPDVINTPSAWVANLEHGLHRKKTVRVNRRCRLNLDSTCYLSQFFRGKRVDLFSDTQSQTHPAGIPGLSCPRHHQVGNFTIGSF